MTHNSLNRNVQTPAWHASSILEALRTDQAASLEQALMLAESECWCYPGKSTFNNEQAEVVLSVAASLRMRPSLALRSASVVLLQNVADQV